MGARATRITRDDLLTPPEFRDFAPTGSEAGRVGGATVELIRVAGETRMGFCYEQVPVRLMPPLQLPPEPASLVYLINLTAGLLDSDGHCINVMARPGTRAVVTGQSATRIHPALKSFSTQQWSVTVEDDACLVVLPGPAIPFQGCRYYQRGRAELAPRARLLWGDLWLPGRYERGTLSERFQFDRIVQDFEVRRGGRLVYRDRFRWDGPWTQEEATWYFGGALASASLFVGGPLPRELPPADPLVRRGVFPLDSGESCLRWCGPPGVVLAELVGLALRIAAAWTVGPDAEPWLLTSSELTPNHWFSAPST
ncbi:MAG: urease accessory protein UreD [Isosphaeraceae bacterium]